MVVYVDVLLVVNLLIDYLLLLLTKTLLRKPVRRFRLLCGALVGAVYSLSIFLPQLPFAVFALLHLSALTCIVLAAFSVHGVRDFLKTAGAFFAVNFVFAGCMLAVYLFLKPGNMLYQNGVVYFDLHFRLLLALTLLCYAVLTLLSYLLRRRAPDNRLFEVVLCCGEKSVREKALLDTGHGLRDGFTDRPVVVAERRVVQRLAPQELQPFLFEDALPPKAGRPICLIPFASVGGAGVLRAFRIDCIRTKKPEKVWREVWLAASPQPFASGEYAVLLGADFLERGETEYAKKAEGAAKTPQKRFAFGRPALHKRAADPAGTARPRRRRGASATPGGGGDAGAGGADCT